MKRRVAGIGSSADATPCTSVDPPDAVPMPADPHHGTVSLGQLGACWVLFTSGTTGTPRAVVLTVDSLTASADMVADALRVSQDDAWYACMPLFHVGGLAIVLRAWRRCARLVTERRFDEHLLVDAMCHHGCTLVSLVPTMLDRVVSGADRPRRRCLSERRVRAGIHGSRTA